VHLQLRFASQFTFYNKPNEFSKQGTSIVNTDRNKILKGLDKQNIPLCNGLKIPVI
jgi:hypothetical protein